MCGGGYIPPAPLQPSAKWSDFWKSVNGGIAIEFVRGCSNHKCHFRCSAYGKPENIMIRPKDWNMWGDKLRAAYMKIILYGNGDVSSYHFNRLDPCPGGQLNIRADKLATNQFLLDNLSRFNTKINCYDLEDLKFANSIDMNHYGGSIEAQIQVKKGSKWEQLIPLCRKTMIIRGVDSSSPGYISPDEFQETIKDLMGAAPTIEEIKCLPSSIIVLEKITPEKEDVTFNFRRCFKDDSPKLAWKIPKSFLEGKRIEETGSHIKKFYDFWKNVKPLTCNHCFPSWKAYFKS